MANKHYVSELFSYVRTVLDNNNYGLTFIADLNNLEIKEVGNDLNISGKISELERILNNSSLPLKIKGFKLEKDGKLLIISFDKRISITYSSIAEDSRTFYFKDISKAEKMLYELLIEFQKP